MARLACSARRIALDTFDTSRCQASRKSWVRPGAADLGRYQRLDLAVMRPTRSGSRGTYAPAMDAVDAVAIAFHVTGVIGGLMVGGRWPRESQRWGAWQGKLLCAFFAMFIGGFFVMYFA